MHGPRVFASVDICASFETLNSIVHRARYEFQSYLSFANPSRSNARATREHERGRLRILSKSCILVNTVTKNVSKEGDSEIKITDSLPPRFETQLFSEESAEEFKHRGAGHKLACLATLIRCTCKCKNAVKISQ